MGNKKIEFKLDYEEIKITLRDPFHVRILKTLGNLLDPFNIPNLVFEAIRNTKFFLEDKYQEEREKLQHVFNLFVPMEFDHVTERVLVRTKNFIDKIMEKSNKMELDLEKISHFIKNLYPIRTAISEHQNVLDVLKDF
ncbi:MAG: hypothetical protein EAX96_03040 [Candidatus Lokiarchaeota archaeon]|nr:hypothetical protein [Candidatus Lokiarchaeota archaeon]